MIKQNQIYLLTGTNSSKEYKVNRRLSCKNAKKNSWNWNLWKV